MRKRNNGEKIRITEKGITLIALVITIVVMLILAGVTINLTLGQNGIFTTAQKATQNYTQAQNQEMADLSNFEEIVDKTIKDTTETWDTLASVAKTGDYVKYDGGNGYTGLWQVLYNDSTYGLQIISAENVLGKNENGEDVKFRLGGGTEEETKNAYNNAVNILNTECRKYVNASYATSGRCVGSNPLNPDDNPETMQKAKLSFEYNGSIETGCVIGDTLAVDELPDYKAMNLAINQNNGGILDIGLTYWLAQRSNGGTAEFAYFNVRNVREGGNGGGDTLYQIKTGNIFVSAGYNYGLRPVITLKPDVETNEGDGSVTSAFELVAK